jgi:hypothetical protein
VSESTELPRAGELEQLQGIVGALSGQVIVLLAQNRALQQLMVDKGVASAHEVRDLTLNILDRELDDLADQLLPAELGAGVKASLREAIAAAKG